VSLLDFLLDEYCQGKSRLARIQTILKGVPTVNQSTRDALQRIADGITNEINEIRQLIANGADSTELDAHLNQIADSVAGISDAVTSEPTT
jgi:uncharacterized protein YoxC